MGLAKGSHITLLQAYCLGWKVLEMGLIPTAQCY